jgi:protein-tyrosine phosphatase
MTVASGAPQVPSRPAPGFTARLMHWWRRHRTVRRLARRAHPPSLLFLCHGNQCRSPYAAGAARRLLPDWVDVTSAGFLAPGRRSPPDAIAAAAELGVDLSAHRSALLTIDHFRNAELVVVMDRDQRRRVVTMRPSLAGRVVLLGDLDPVPATGRDVPDPVNQPLDAFRSSYTRIDRCVRALVAVWSQPAGQQPRG